ncbi:MAG: hypothetical protein JO073_16040 [Actinobacteria bacterium]|nr:hypothetical protein [Actinomycetota bacterium]
MLTGTSQHPVERRGPGGWLRQRRTRLALWIAAAEGVVVAVSHDVTKWTVAVLAVVAVLSWSAGRNTKYGIVRQVLWIFAASQLLALVLVILGWVVKWALILALVVFAIGGLVFLFVDRR